MTAKAVFPSQPDGGGAEGCISFEGSQVKAQPHNHHGPEHGNSATASHRGSEIDLTPTAASPMRSND